MTSDPHADGVCYAPVPELTPAQQGVSARDRVLLYTRGMDVAPLLSLELALESLRRADPADPDIVMRELHSLLREHKIGQHLAGCDGAHLRSTPPMIRRPMIAEEMDRIPLLTALKRIFRKLGTAPDQQDKGSGA